ncbi:unnamed protein product [Calypogeia fissa]
MESPVSKAGASPRRGYGRFLVAPLLLLGLVGTLIFWFLAATDMNLFMNRLNRYLTTGQGSLQQIIGTFAGNVATIFLMIFSLIGGVAALASYVVGLHHLRVWTKYSSAAAQAAAWVGFFFLLLPFVMVWKEVQLGGHLGHKTKTVGAFAVIVTLVHFAYVLVLYVTV